MIRRVKKRRKSIGYASSTSGLGGSTRAGPSIGSCLRLRLRPAKMRSVCGSSASLIPSPSRLKAKVVISSAADGKIRNHHEVVYHVRESEIMLPQLGVGGTTPTPRNDRVASNTIALGTSRVAITMTGAMTLGRISMNMIRSGLDPVARAASTYSFSLRDRV